MKIGFGILLDDESYNYARKLETELCEKFGLCWGLKQDPHITIKAPFDTDNLEPFVKYFEELAKNVNQFEIELIGFNYFESKVIFLDVKENYKLKKLHLKILKDMKQKFDIGANEYEGKKIKFHSSIVLEDVTKRKFEKARKYLKKYNPKLKFKAKYLGIFYYLGKAAGWIVIRKIKLKNS